MTNSSTTCKIVSEQRLRKLRSVYADVRDVDAYVGMYLERRSKYRKGLIRKAQAKIDFAIVRFRIQLWAFRFGNIETVEGRLLDPPSSASSGSR